jgi:5'-3' exonuclease
MTVSFKKMAGGPTGSNLMIVDAMNLAFRWKHQGKLDFQKDYHRTINSLAKSYDCSKIIIAADWGSSSYRKSIYPEYKQNRKELIDAQTAEEKEFFEKFFQEYERVLLSFSTHPVVRFKGVEADDIAAYITQNVRDYRVEHTWLISSDRDWDLLVSENISRFSYVTRKETTLEAWPYEVPPDKYASYKAIMGDPGDNIIGIPGIGPKRAAELVNTYGSALDIYDMCPFDSKYKYMQSLNQHCDRILNNMELVDLIAFCEDAIGSENILDINKILNEYLAAL